MIAKLKTVEEELDETSYWIELAVAVSEHPVEDSTRLQREAEELMKIVVASIKTLRSRSETEPVSTRSSVRSS
jgi:four helix bundle protein